MTIKDLLNMIDPGQECDIMVQVCTNGGNWEDFEVLRTDGMLIRMIKDKRIKCMGAISKDCFRIDIDWNEEE